MSQPDTPEAGAAIARGQATAHAACELGLTQLRDQVAIAPEYRVSGKANGGRIIVPERALMAGMLAHLERTMAAQRTRQRKVA